MTAIVHDGTRLPRLPRGEPAPAPGRSAEQAPRRPSLSPSRAADFKTCPLLYRFRTIDRLPERKSLAAVRGTLVHSVLERLYDLPAAERTVEAAQELVRAGLGGAARGARASPSSSRSPRSDGAETDVNAPESVEAWLASAGKLVEKLLHPRGPDPHPARRAARSWSRSRCPTGCCCAATSTGSTWRRNGALRVVDYKTGSMPREAFEGKALFQMKFYALVLWRTRGVVAAQLKLIYLGDGDALTYAPDEEELLRFERTLLAIWSAIERAVATGDFRPNKTRLCGWCDHQAVCPAFGGTPPPFPTEAAAAAGWPTLPIVERD